MEHKTGRREAVKVLGGLAITGASLAIAKPTSAQPRPGREARANATQPGTVAARGAPKGTTTAPPATPSRGGEQPRQQAAPAVAETQRGEVDRLLAPLVPGALLGDAVIKGITGVRLGAAAVTLEARGWKVQVDICRRDRGKKAHQPVASTRRYELFVVNGGKGRKPTNQQLARTIGLLARTIQNNEKKTTQLELLTLRARLQRHPRGRFDARP